MKEEREKEPWKVFQWLLNEPKEVNQKFSHGIK